MRSYLTNFKDNYNVVIVGSRTYDHMDLVIKFVQELPDNVTVISGGADGVDTVAVLEARKKGLKVHVEHADWKKYNKSAGPIRNKIMVDMADYVIAFWDEASRGTKNTIKLAVEQNKLIRLFGKDGVEHVLFRVS